MPVAELPVDPTIIAVGKQDFVVELAVFELLVSVEGRRKRREERKQ